MTRTYQLERRQFISLPLDEVFAFFADAGNLETITPTSLRFKILTPLPIAMHPGATINYRLKLVGIGFKWQTLIETFEPPHRFTDIQSRGPYKLWHHTHEFTAVDGGTQVVDRVRYQLPLGPIGWLAHQLFVHRQLKNIFDFRAKKLAAIFGVKDSADEKPLINANAR